MSADSYIGKSPQYGYFEKQRITSANGVLTSFALAFTTADSSQLLVSVGGVIQEPGQSYTVDASVPQNIVFTEAPASSIEIFIIWMGKQTTGPTFGAAMLTDKTSLGTQPAAADTFLLYDDTASALKKVTYTNLIPSTHGDVSGPASSTDEALARFDSTTGKILLNSTATLTDAGTLTATAFSGPLTGNVTGNASGTAATVTGATQSAITALGTIASLVATTADINAGTFDGIVGGTTPAAGSFTNVVISTDSKIHLDGTTAGNDYLTSTATGNDPVELKANGYSTTFGNDIKGSQATGFMINNWQGAATTVATFSIKTDYNTGLGFGQNDILSLVTAGISRIYIDAAGEVGIGNTSPGAVLETLTASGDIARFYSTQTGNDNIVRVSTNASDSSAGIFFQNTHASRNNGSGIRGNTGGQLTFNTGLTAGQSNYH